MIVGGSGVFQPWRSAALLLGEVSPRSDDGMEIDRPAPSGPRPLAILTAQLTQCYERCNPVGFAYSDAQNPRRVLTKPSEPAGNEGFDNAHGDLILAVNDVLEAVTGAGRNSFRVLDLLGAGTFGQVARVQNARRPQEVFAVKITKNKPAYFNQALMEIKILRLLNDQCDPNDTGHICRMVDFFVFRRHLCLMFEVLNFNLYEVVKQNQFRGLSLSLLRSFLRQLLGSLQVLREARVIHCDIKV